MRLAVDAPRDVSVHREEIYRLIQDESRQASELDASAKRCCHRELLSKLSMTDFIGVVKACSLSHVDDSIVIERILQPECHSMSCVKLGMALQAA